MEKTISNKKQSVNKAHTANSVKIYDIVITGLMAALVFVGTYFFKIPTSFGYTHLGDCMIILTVCMFGTRKGVLAGAIGAGLSDLLGGYTVWVLPTMLFKGIWALIMGIVAYKLLPKVKFNWLIGASVCALVHIALYTLIKIPLYGMEYALLRIPIITGQTICGIVFGSALYMFIKSSGILRNVKLFTKKGEEVNEFKKRGI